MRTIQLFSMVYDDKNYFDNKNVEIYGSDGAIGRYFSTALLVCHVTVISHRAAV